MYLKEFCILGFKKEDRANCYTCVISQTEVFWSSLFTYGNNLTTLFTFDKSIFMLTYPGM